MGSHSGVEYNFFHEEGQKKKGGKCSLEAAPVHETKISNQE